LNPKQDQFNVLRFVHYGQSYALEFLNIFLGADAFIYHTNHAYLVNIRNSIVLPETFGLTNQLIGHEIGT
jgi:hypothetical protein